MRVLIGVCLLAAGGARAQEADDAGLDLRGPAQDTARPGVDPEPLAAPPPVASSGSVLAGQNYGRPKKLVPKPPLPLRRGARALPPLQPYKGAVRPRGTATGRPDADGELAPNIAAVPAPIVKPRPRVDEKPFEPLGVNVGSLRLRPYVETGLGYDSNPNRTAPPVKGSGFLRLDAGLDVVSDFSSNSLTASLRGGYSDYFSVSSANRPDAVGVVDGRLDVTRDLSLNAEGRFAIETQRPGSPNLQTGIANAFVVGRPLITSYGGTLGIADQINRLGLSLRGSVDRTDYADARLSNGGVLALSGDSFFDPAIKARASYEVTPGLIPFIEVGADTRLHDRTIDSSGFARNSVGETAKLGATFEFTRLLTGQADVGFTHRTYDDKRLRNVNGPLADASLAWAVTPLTTVTLKGATAFDETMVPGASTAETRRVSLEVAHALFRNVTLTAIGSFQTTNYLGAAPRLVENSYAAGLKAEYALNRNVVLKASYSHEQLHSTAQNASYAADVLLVGVRLQP